MYPWNCHFAETALIDAQEYMYQSNTVNCSVKLHTTMKLWILQRQQIWALLIKLSFKCNVLWSAALKQELSSNPYCFAYLITEMAIYPSNLSEFEFASSTKLCLIEP